MRHPPIPTERVGRRVRYFESNLVCHRQCVESGEQLFFVLWVYTELSTEFSTDS